MKIHRRAIVLAPVALAFPPRAQTYPERPIRDVLADPAVKTRLAELGNEIRAMTPGGLAAFLAREDQTVAELAKTGLLKPE